MAFDPLELENFIACYGQTSVAPLASSGSNKVIELLDGKAVVGLRLIHSVAVTVGEPICEPGLEQAALEDLLTKFKERRWASALVAVSEQTKDMGLQLGMHCLQIAKDSIIDLEDFTLSGHAHAKLRRSVNHAKRDGLTAMPYSEDKRTPELDEQLQTISNAWLANKHGGELGFTLGRFDPAELERQEVYIALHEGEAVAFATWLPYRDDKAAVVDLMRRNPEHCPPGVMDLLIVHCLEDFRERGRELVSLGGVGLADERATKELRGIERGLHWIFLHGGHVYDAKGLFAFKQKFVPRLEPLYLLYSKATTLPRIAIAIEEAYRKP